MDLIEKMVKATEGAIIDQTGFEKLEFSFDEADNARSNYATGFSVRPTGLAQVEGGVGFVFFNQGFRLSIYQKIYKSNARLKLFELSAELAKIFQRLYTIRVSGDGYQVVDVRGVTADEPSFKDTYIQIDVEFVALVRMVNLFRGR